MVIAANAFYQEDRCGMKTDSLRVSIQINSETPKADERARVIARSLFENMAITVNQKGGEGNVVK